MTLLRKQTIGAGTARAQSTDVPHSMLEFSPKAILETMRDEAVKALSELAACDVAEGYQGDEADRASARSEVESYFQEREALQAKIADIHRALRKLSQGEYGICEATGSEIPAARLIANPLARYTVEHQAVLERKARLGLVA